MTPEETIKHINRADMDVLISVRQRLEQLRDDLTRQGFSADLGCGTDDGGHIEWSLSVKPQRHLYRCPQKAQKQAE